MPLRLLVASFALTVAAVLAVAACKTSSPYGTPANVGIGTGLAVAAAAANRAVTHECWGACRPGTVCDKATGFCVEPGHRSGANAHPAGSGAGGEGREPIRLTSEAYPPGHEYDVPAMSMVDAGCAPGHAGDAGAALACEMDGGGEI